MTLLFADHGEGLGNAVAVIRNNVASAGLGAPVPTAPGWTARDLVEHAGAKLRWVSSVLRGGPLDSGLETGRADALADVGEYPDLLDWFDECAVATLNDLVATPRDAEVPYFLPAAPAVGREAWAQFCCHEMTVHGIDAMAARMRAVPPTAALWFAPQQAMDGLDQLLRGFVPRWERVLIEQPLRGAWSLAVLPDDATDAVARAVEASDADIAELARGWTARLAADAGGTFLSVELGADEAATAIVRGKATGVFAALWNRGEDIRVDGDAAVVEHVRTRLRIA